MLQLLQDRGEGQLTFREGNKEPILTECLTTCGLGASGSAGGAEAEEVLDLLGGDLLVSSEDIGLGATSKGELMNLDHSTKCDQTHQCVLRDEGEGHEDGVLECLELIFREASIHYEEIDGREGVAGRKGIFNSGIVGDELSREVGLTDIRIVCRELVSLVAYWAHPQFSTHIHSATLQLNKPLIAKFEDIPIWVQYRVTWALAIYRLIRDLKGSRLVFLQRCVSSSNSTSILQETYMVMSFPPKIQTPQWHHQILGAV